MGLRKAKNFLKKDKRLNDLTFSDIKIRKGKNYFDTLTTAIIYQQISGLAAKSIHKRLYEYCNKKITPEKVARITSARMRKMGISSQKTSYIKDLARMFLNKEINTRKFRYQSDEEIVEELTKVRGIGVWTAQMFLIFSLGRKDVFPTSDLGIQKAVEMLVSKKVTPDEMEQMSQKWRPYRTYVSLALWTKTDVVTPEGG